MAVINVSDVNQFLPETKLEQTTLPTDLEATARANVFAELASDFDVSDWTQPDNTPPVVKMIVAMFVAGWVYNRQHSEQSGDNNAYANRLLGYAASRVRDIKGGSVAIDAERHAELWPSTLDTEPIFEIGKVF